MEICDINFFQLSPALLNEREKQDKKQKFRNLACEITKTPQTLAENNVFMLDSIAYS